MRPLTLQETALPKQPVSLALLPATAISRPSGIASSITWIVVPAPFLCLFVFPSSSELTVIFVLVSREIAVRHPVVHAQVKIAEHENRGVWHAPVRSK